VGADAVESLERELGRDVRMTRDERRVARRGDGELETKPLRVVEPERAVAARGRDAVGREPRLPEVECPSEPTRKVIVCTMPSPARPELAPGYSKNVMSAPGLPCSSA